MKHYLRITVFKDGKDLSKHILLKEFPPEEYNSNLKLNVKSDSGGRLQFPKEMNNDFWVAVHEYFHFDMDEKEVLMKNGMLQDASTQTYNSR